MKKLIINADDFGLAKNFNKGIIKLAKVGIVSSTTVMVDKKYTGKHWFSEDLEGMKKHMSIGLHLLLSEKTTQIEIESQIKKFKEKVGVAPSHLDGHQHCHLTKSNLPKVIKVAKKHNLPIRSTSPSYRKLLKQEGIKTPSEYIAWHPSRKERLLERLKSIKRGVVEMVCHVGYKDPNSAYPYNKERNQELNLLKSNEFHKVIEDFEIVGYDYFKNKKCR